MQVNNISQYVDVVGEDRTSIKDNNELVWEQTTAWRLCLPVASAVVRAESAGELTVSFEVLLKGAQSLGYSF